MFIFDQHEEKFCPLPVCGYVFSIRMLLLEQKMITISFISQYTVDSVELIIIFLSEYDNYGYDRGLIYKMDTYSSMEYDYLVYFTSI